MSDYIPHDDKRRAKNLNEFHGKTPKEIKNARWYHGTVQDFTHFKPGRAEAIFLSKNPNFANEFASQGAIEQDWDEKNKIFIPRDGSNIKPNMMPVHVRAENPFDYQNKKHINALIERLGPQLINDPFLMDMIPQIRRGSWDAIESIPVQKAIKSMGHDSFFVNETGEKNLAVYDPSQIKSATGNRGTFDQSSPDITKAEGGAVDLSQYQEQTPFGLYSHAAETAAALPQAKGTPDQFKGMLLRQGVKPAEIENSNYDATFAGRPSVTKDELAQHFRQSMPQLTETLFSKDPRYANYATGPSRYHNYTIPGGENYREVVIKKPVPTKRVGVLSTGETLSEEELQDPIVRRTAEKIGLVMEDRPIDEEDAYKHGHWPGVRNPIAHIRMSDRQGPNGEKILHVEELQSDWGQEGRSSGFMDPHKKKEYEDHMREYRALGDKAEELAKATEQQLGIKSPEYSQIVGLFPEMEQISKRMNHLYMNEPDKPMGKPYHPYVASTGAWTDLALKRVLHEAALGGYDKVVVTPGEEQAARFDLSNHLSRIVATPSKDGLIHLDLHDHESPEDPFETFSNIHPKDLGKHVGKELADRIMKEIKFPEDQKVWRIQSKVSDMKTGTTPSFERINEAFDQYPEHIRNTLEIVPVMEKRGGKEADLRGLNLKVGGEGMKGFYDRIVPKQLNDMVKRHDPSVKMRHDTIDTERGPQPVHAIDITPKLRESVLRGQRAFSTGGEVDDEGITAYHGSPHDFDQFSMDKIGTGEGAQAYGHGLYFAGAEPVAQTYRGDPEERYRRFSGHMDPKEEYAFDLASHSGDVREFDVMMGLAKKYGENISFEEAEQLAKEAVSKRGHMYEVHIAAHPDHFLDWDKPLSKQSEHVQNALSQHPKANRLFGNDVVKGQLTEPTGQSILNRLLGSQEEKSKQLHDLGIRGIKYLDAGSRDGGEGSRNYVVFDDKLVAIKRKYARGGSVAA